MKTYRDTVHGFRARCRNRMTAWMTIRAKCHELQLRVPLFTEVVED